MNTAQASRLVFEHLLKYSLKCQGVPNMATRALGIVCQHNLTEEHDVLIPNMEANPWLIYKAEIAFMELGAPNYSKMNTSIQIKKSDDLFYVSISTYNPERWGMGTERTLLKAKLMAFASYIYNSFTKEETKNNDS